MSSAAPPASGSVGDTIRDLAVPRLHGTAAADRTADTVRDRLRRLGYEVQERPFRFSRAPGLWGATVVGLILATMLPAAAVLAASGQVALARAILVVPAGIGLFCVLFADRLILGLPVARSDGCNLLAKAPCGRARFLVVAHRDSKSQPIPLVLRVAGAIATVLAWVALAAIAMFGGSHPTIATIAGFLGGIGGLVVACCGVGNASDGALDNASGVAALIRIAGIEAERGSDDVAFLVTDAEELGLAGARAEVDAFPDAEAIINLDGLDDDGPIVLVEGRSPFPRPPSRLTWSLDQEAAAAGIAIRHRGLPPGLLLDHVPFSRAGLPAFTVLRGGLRSLTRVHRPADRADRLTGEGAAGVARIVSGALARIRTRSQPDPGMRVAQDTRTG